MEGVLLTASFGGRDSFNTTKRNMNLQENIGSDNSQTHVTLEIIFLYRFLYYRAVTDTENNEYAWLFPGRRQARPAFLCAVPLSRMKCVRDILSSEQFYCLDNIDALIWDPSGGSFVLIICF